MIGAMIALGMTISLTVVWGAWMAKAYIRLRHRIVGCDWYCDFCGHHYIPRETNPVCPVCFDGWR